MTINEQSLALLKDVSSETRQSLLKPEIRHCYRKGEQLFRDREVTPYIFIIVQGKAALYKISENGQKKVAFILGPGEIINEELQSDVTSSVSCEAFENLEVIRIEKSRMEKLMRGDFELVKIMLAAGNRKVRRLYRQLKNTTGVLKMERRVAAKLWKLAKDYGVDTALGWTIDLDISITYLADLMGSTRETISRALKLLNTQRLVRLDKGRITVVDMDALSAYFKE